MHGRPFVELRTPGGRRARVPAGGFIGRHVRADLQLDDPRVSAYHAAVLLRGRSLRLQALRGELRVDGEREGEFPLLEGQEIEIAAGYRLVVEGLVVPDAVVGLDVGLDEPVELSASCYSLVVDGGWRLLPEFAARARAWFWTEEGGWRARVGRAPAEPATPGMAWEIDGRRVSMVAIPVTDAGTPSTQRSGQPLRLVLRSDTVRVDVGERVVHLDGKPAEIVWELHEMGRVAPISALAAELWRRDPADADVLRRRLDRHLAVLRSKLRGRGVRSDLVRATGTGLLELVINPGDTVEVDEPG